MKCIVSRPIDRLISFHRQNLLFEEQAMVELYRVYSEYSYFLAVLVFATAAIIDIIYIF